MSLGFPEKQKENHQVIYTIANGKNSIKREKKNTTKKHRKPKGVFSCFLCWWQVSVPWLQAPSSQMKLCLCLEALSSHVPAITSQPLFTCAVDLAKLSASAGQGSLSKTAGSSWAYTRVAHKHLNSETWRKSQTKPFFFLKLVLVPWKSSSNLVGQITLWECFQLLRWSRGKKQPAMGEGEKEMGREDIFKLCSSNTKLHPTTAKSLLHHPSSSLTSDLK